MRYLILTGFLIFLPIGHSDALPGYGKPFVTNDFEVGFTGKVTITKKQGTSADIVEVTEYMQSTADYAYGVTAVQYRKPTDVEIAARAVVDDLRCQIVSKDLASVAGDLSAVEISANHCNDDLALQSRSFSSGSYLYLVMALHRDSPTALTAGRRFVRSFRLKKLLVPIHTFPERSS
jgi:hypothetical protein